MVLEADRNGCVREVMVIAAALSIQDPRERPSDKQQQADQQHARFKDETSDFLAFLNLWRYVREQQKALSSSAFRRMCRSRVPELPADTRVAGHLLPAALGRQDHGHSPQRGGCGARPHSHLPAFRFAFAYRTQGHGRQERVSGRPQRQVRGLPRLRALQEAPALDHVRGAGRDVPPVGAGERQDRAGVGRAAGTAPGEADVQRAALGAEDGGGDGVRAGDALRRADRRPAEDHLRPHRPGDLTGPVHP